jgi:hypothetical protein
VTWVRAHARGGIAQAFNDPGAVFEPVAELRALTNTPTTLDDLAPPTEPVERQRERLRRVLLSARVDDGMKVHAGTRLAQLLGPGEELHRVLLAAIRADPSEVAGVMTQHLASGGDGAEMESLIGSLRAIPNTTNDEGDAHVAT